MRLMSDDDGFVNACKIIRERKRGREKERERERLVVLPHNRTII